VGQLLLAASEATRHQRSANSRRFFVRIAHETRHHFERLLDARLREQ
jgi:hypothetical protein